MEDISNNRGIKAYVFCDWYFCKNCCLDCYMCTCKDPCCYCFQFEDWTVMGPQSEHKYCDCFYNSSMTIKYLCLLLISMIIGSLIVLLFSPILIPLLIIMMCSLSCCFLCFSNHENKIESK